MSEAKRCEILLLDERKLDILVQVMIFINFHNIPLLNLFQDVGQ